jgi:hypothetical protein
MSNTILTVAIDPEPNSMSRNEMIGVNEVTERGGSIDASLGDLAARLLTLQL